MNIETLLSEHLKKFESAPFLFVGSGFSRRYLGLEDWHGLLRRFASFSERPYEYFVSSTESGAAEQVASLLANEFHPHWFQSDSYKVSRDKNISKVIDRSSPLKIEIANYLNDKAYIQGHSTSLDAEIQSLLEVSKNNSIDGIITTNWDTLLEQLFTESGFKKYVGQKELLFTSSQEIAEIYKIHGCCTEPNSLVLTEEDYRHFNERNPYLAAKLLTIFIEHPVLFVGYSISDENIQSILGSITACLTNENIGKLRDRLIFLERAKEGEEDAFYDAPMVINTTNLPITRIRANSFEPVYNALAQYKRKYPAKVMRKMKSQIYEMILNNDPRGQLHAIIDLDRDDIDLSTVEFVVGVGITQQLSTKGYESISPKELFEGIIFDNHLDPVQVVKKTIPQVLKNDGFIPVFKYVADSQLIKTDLDDKIQTRLEIDFDHFLTQTVRSKGAHVSMHYNTIEELQKNYPLHMTIELIPMLGENGIDKKELLSFITENFKLIESKDTLIRSNFRKLIRVYDYLENAARISYADDK
ncbi:SIR2 family protein [Gorillibacterium sp. CAU 1737]|uniref:SIR2 family protein n=1 Tax=Gorillibacterium sp. CAU 1737 TaxID=3140362 RepID=UPI0032619A27